MQSLELVGLSSEKLGARLAGSQLHTASTGALNECTVLLDGVTLLHLQEDGSYA